jgi:class 3 adenylate cyclase/tetratricopeptide (TPR) repeat protein
MRCSQCQCDNPAGQKFCGECGARLALSCPACDATNPFTNKFCGDCGAKLTASPPRADVAASPAPVMAPPAAPTAPPSTGRFASPETYTPKHLAEKILTSRSAIEGERKQVTVMFTDVSGFTAMSERLDPEEVHAIMDRAFEVILAAVHGYEGSINQFLGDGVMALFGAPIAHEDHAGRAIRAALAIQEGLEPLRADVQRTQGRDFLMRIGINTGPVVVGAIGRDLRMDYTALGDTVNLASRLLNVAQPGQVVVSRRTKEPCEGFFVFEDLGDFQVKGKSEPVRGYAAKGEIRGRTRLEVSRERGLTPLVGRGPERQRLASAFRQTSDGAGAVVLIAGDAGVGKSRLLYEFLRSLDASRHLELETTCASYGHAIAYRPIMELYRRYLGLPEGVSPEEIRRVVTERLASLNLRGEEPAILFAHFLGVPAPPEFLLRVQGAQLKARTNDLLASVLVRESERAPVVLVIENVHWIDASSEEFLKLLADRVQAHAVLLVLTTRPGPSMERLPASTETIRLEGLDTEDVRGMVHALLGTRDVAASLLQILIAKGAGNPLYVEEILRQLQETGGILVEEGEARLRATALMVPETIRDIITSRVDRLMESRKHTLQVASVVGRRFGVSLVSRVVNGGREQVAADLNDLHASDFVFPSAQDPELMYSFKHALTQDVVYASLLERRRRVYHAAAGRGLEELYEGRIDEVVELLAHHFGASAEDDKAVDYALGAAEKSQRRWANAEALVYFESALKRLDAMPDTTANQLRRIDAVVKQSEVKFALGRHAEHVEALERIKDLVDAVADPPRRATWYYWTGFLQSLIGRRPEDPIRYCREALAIADATGFDDVRPFAECCLAHVLMTAGDLRGALEIGERALRTFEERGNTWWACRALWALSPVANYLGEWERGLEYCRRALEYGRAVDDLRLKVVGWWRTGSTHIQRGDPEPGLSCCEEALALSPIAFDAAMIRAVRAYGLVKTGDVAAGTAELAEAVAWFERSQLHYTRSLFALWLAEGHLALGQRSEARAVLDTVVASTRQNGYRHLEGVAGRLVAEALGPEDPAALDHLALATRILEEVGARNEIAKVLVARAGCHRAAGNVAAARTALEQALAVFTSLGTVDGPLLVASLLRSLPNGIDTERAQPAS